MNKLLCIITLALASSSLQALSINHVANWSLQDAFIIAYTRPEITNVPTNLNRAFIGMEKAVCPLESTVYLVTRTSISKEAEEGGPITIGDNKLVVVTTSKGQTMLDLSKIPGGVLEALIVDNDGTLHLLK